MRPYTTTPNPSGKNPVWAVVKTISQILRGRTNNIGDVTLTQSSTTTVIDNPLITPLSHIDITALTANAAAALVGHYVSSRTSGSATITHTLNANSDLQCTYTVWG